MREEVSLLKSRILPSLLLLLCWVAAPIAHADGVPPPPDLGDVMDDMSSTVKALNAQLSDPKSNVDSAAKAETLRGLILKSLPLVPPKIDKMDPKDPTKATELLAYQKMIAQLYSTATDLELAFLNRDNAAAATAFAQLGPQKKAGHDRFKEPEKQ